MTKRREPARGLGSLSERERGVLALLVKGLTNREIAEEIGISTGTVKKREEARLPHAFKDGLEDADGPRHTRVHRLAW